MLAACLALLVLASVLDSRHNRHAADERAAVQLAEALYPPVRASLAAGDTAALVAALRNAQADPRVDFTIVQDADGLIVAATSRQGFDVFQARVRILAECWEPAGREARLLTLGNGGQVMLCSIPLAPEGEAIAAAGESPAIAGASAAGSLIADPGGVAAAATAAGALIANQGRPAPTASDSGALTAAAGRPSDNMAGRSAGLLRVGVAPKGLQRLQSLWRPAPSHRATPDSPSAGSRQVREALERAEVASQNYDIEEAIRHLKEAIRLDPRCAIAYARLAIRSDSKSAEALADTAMALLDGASPYEQLYIRIVHAQVENDQESGDRIKADLFEQHPDVPEVREMRAERLADMGYRDQAITEWRRLARAEPGRPGVYNRLGYLLAEKGQYEEALKYLVQYAWLLPDRCNPHDSLGEMFQLFGRYADAEREFRKAIQIDPGFGWNCAHLATLSAERGRFGEALARLEYIEKTWKSSPRRLMDLVERRVLLEIQRGQSDEALALVRRYETPEMEWSGAHYWRGLICVDQGRVNDARQEASLLLAALKVSYQKQGKLVALAAEDPEYHLLLGRIYQAEGNYEEARANFAAAIAAQHLYIDNLFTYQQWEPRLALARLALHRDDSGAALAEVAPILNTNPLQTDALLLTAQACTRLGHPARARTALTTILAQRVGADPSPEIDQVRGLLAELDAAGVEPPATPVQAATEAGGGRSATPAVPAPTGGGGRGSGPDYRGRKDQRQ